MADTVNYYGVAITRLTARELLREIRRTVDQRTTLVASYIHLHTVNLIGGNPQIRKTFALFDIVIPDGIAVLWSSILFGTSFRRGQIVTTYESVLPVLAAEAIREGWSFFLFGAAPGVAARAKDNLVRAFPGIRIAGTHHGYLEPNEDTDAVVDLIARSKPTILLVGLPQPKQEAWILRHRAELGASVVLAVGGYFDKLAKNVSIYPEWVKRGQLYWLYRLLTEPRRVWKRYTFGVPLFVWNILWTRFRGGHQSLGRAA